MAELQAELNRLAGTTNLDMQGAANVLAGTVGLDLVGALNVAAGTVGLELNGAIKAYAAANNGDPTLDSNAALLGSAGNAVHIITETGKFLSTETGLYIKV